MKRPGFLALCLGATVFMALIAVLLCAHLTSAADPAQGIRKPVFAGSFYPADKATLNKAVGDFLKAAEARGGRASGPVFGLMAPHAGYQYSGAIAGLAYYQVKGKPFKTVILIGPSHRAAFRGIAVDPAGAWETPLGKVRINSEMADRITKKCGTLVRPYPPAFQMEHSLEVQLPFLQKSLGDFTLVPLLTGTMDRKDVRIAADALASILRAQPHDVLVVASSDMSHYHSYGTASEMDRKTLADIESLDTEKLTGRLEREESELCGAEAALVLLTLAGNMKAEARVLGYANSGDTGGDKSRVVGYGAVAFSYGEANRSLNSKEQATLLSLARKAVEASVSGREAPAADIRDPRLSEKAGAFVTLTRNGMLRGCVGYIAPVLPLYRAVSEMAVAASSQDYRFRPVSKEELKDLRIEISVLSPLKPVTGIEEIKVGTHGLYITRGRSSGLLLPQVAVEHHWNREEFLKQTCVKAGLPPDAWKDNATIIHTFSAQIFSE